MGSSSAAPTPDFKTGVNVHEHSISLKEQRSARARNLEDIKSRTGGSLIPESMKHIEEDEEHAFTAENLRKLGQAQLTREERKKRRRALDNLGVPSFDEFLARQEMVLEKKPIEILQLNIGLYCNQACNHCHVESSPKRKEMMSAEVAQRCVELMEACPTVHTLDITGGAPELNDQFRYLVKEGRRLGKEVIDRCNLTVLSEPGQEDLAAFLAENKVRVVASLPCYSEKNVDTQRGRGVFDKSIHGLLQLNQLGYGVPGSGLSLDLVYNPLGAFLPPEQTALEAQYRAKLAEDFGIVFTSLFTLSNMPVKRFADFLHRRGELQQYMELLVRNFNVATVPGLMCTNLVSVGWDGKIFDCDFNQQLAIPMLQGDAATLKVAGFPTVFDVAALADTVGCKVATDGHCFGCTAGNGSSCQGATA
ncbi:hypothetical protein T484DRAFT_1634310 [Baffinella frigidus]|nr:hypothetical protein T484DRAFT_1634310 [Cryptophyta sp. CCMP2293]